MPFTGRLAILNRPTFAKHQAKADFLEQNGAGLGTWGVTVPPAHCSLTEVNSWLAEVDAGDQHASVAVPLRAFKTAIMPQLVGMAGVAGAGRAAAAVFLVEVLRIYNKARHEAAVIQEIVTDLGQCNVPIVGNVQACIALTTFGDLAYSPHLANVRMIP